MSDAICVEQKKHQEEVAQFEHLKGPGWSSMLRETTTDEVSEVFYCTYNRSLGFDFLDKEASVLSPCPCHGQWPMLKPRGKRELLKSNPELGHMCNVAVPWFALMPTLFITSCTAKLNCRSSKNLAEVVEHHVTTCLFIHTLSSISGLPQTDRAFGGI